MRQLGLVLLISIAAGCGTMPGTTGKPDLRKDTTGMGDGPGAGNNPDLSMNGGSDDLSTDPSMDDMTVPPNGGPDMAMMCSKPSTLHPPKAGQTGIYCPFSVAPPGKQLYCTAGTQHCCEPAMGLSTCTASGTACPQGDTDWKCEDSSNCAAGQQCCGTGTLVVNPDPMCANYGSKFKGAHCAASCTASEIVMCTSNAECGGKTCTPFKTKGNSVGGCM